MNHIEEKIKLGRETQFAVLGRAIADAARTGQPYGHLVAEAAQRRQQEQDSADRLTQFAALVRQIGDAVRVGRDTAPFVQRLAELRDRELGAVDTQSQLESTSHLRC